MVVISALESPRHRDDQDMPGAARIDRNIFTIQPTLA